MESKIHGVFDVAVNEEAVKGKEIFVAHCLNRGIASQGYSYEETINNIKEAIKLYLEENPEESPKKKREIF